MKALAVALLLSGCAAQSAPLDVAGKDPTCARSCLASHSQCASQAGIGTDNRPAVNDVLRACRATADACLYTCPVR